MKIKNITVADARIVFDFEDGKRLTLWDDGQSCCELRYFHTDDDLEYYKGAEFISWAVEDGPTTRDEYNEPTDSQFLKIATSLGVFTVVAYNEHNGYYGGFWIKEAWSNGGNRS